MICAGSGANSADALVDLKTINVAISGRQLELTVQKNLLQAEELKRNLESRTQPEAAQAGKKSKVSCLTMRHCKEHASVENKEKAAR